MQSQTVPVRQETRNVPCGCPCNSLGCTDPTGHHWTRGDVARLAGNKPRTVGKHARNFPNCPLYKVGHGRGVNGCAYTYAEAQAYLRWLEQGKP